VETELVIYPREGHRIGEELHSRDVLTRTTRWLAEHVKAGANESAPPKPGAGR
jgi:dipeptidyl aminopeptidase/acylaminoacyl peptidase